MPEIQLAYFMLGFFGGTMLMLAFILLYLKLRQTAPVEKKSSQPASLAELQECYTILLKTSRRCARDLRHAADLIDRKRFGDETVDFLFDRHRHYETVFGGTNDYRLELHRRIDSLEDEVETWKSFAEPELHTPQ